MRLSETEYQALKHRLKPVQTLIKEPKDKPKMNGLESSYAQYLDYLKRTGEIIDWKFEPFNIRLADKCFYKIDFLVITKDKQIELHETKGRWEDDALVKFKVAAEQFPWFVFKAIMRKDGHFYVERMG